MLVIRGEVKITVNSTGTERHGDRQGRERSDAEVGGGCSAGTAFQAGRTEKLWRALHHSVSVLN